MKRMSTNLKKMSQEKQKSFDDFILHSLDSGVDAINISGLLV